jgi:hypothetical protein
MDVVSTAHKEVELESTRVRSSNAATRSSWRC